MGITPLNVCKPNENYKTREAGGIGARYVNFPDQGSGPLLFFPRATGLNRILLSVNNEGQIFELDFWPQSDSRVRKSSTTAGSSL